MRKTVIYFKSKKALDYLLKNGEVYTLRPKIRKIGFAWVKAGRKKVADVVVEYVGEVVQTLPDDEWFVCERAYAKAKLENFVEKSGFESVEEWLEEVKRLNGGKLPRKLYLYKVSLLDVKKKIKIFAGEYEKSLERKKEQLLENVALVLIRIKCIATDERRNFLFLFFVSKNDILPKILIFHDEKCAYCGKHLIDTEESAKCVICGKEFGRGLKITCVDGHYICNECYVKLVKEPLVEIIYNIIRNYDIIKKKVSESVKSYLRDLYTYNPKLAKAVAFRNAMTSLFEEFARQTRHDMEVSVFTNPLIPDIEHLLYVCMECEKRDRCESARELFADLGLESKILRR